MKRVIAVKTFDDFMRDLNRENFENTTIIIKERPTQKVRFHLQKLQSVLSGMSAEVIFRTDITDAMIHALSDHIKTENEKAFWKEVMNGS